MEMRANTNLVLLFFRHVPIPIELLLKLETRFFISTLLSSTLESDVEVLVGEIVS